MSIDNITSKILEEAVEQGKIALSEAENESRKIIEDAKKRAEKILEESRQKIMEEGELIKSRRVSVAELEVRKIRLGAMQAQISKCFDKALDKIADMSESEYLELLSSKVLAIGGDGGELILNAKDRNSIGEKLLAAINASGKVGALGLADDVIEAKGGFVLRRGAVEINSTLETMTNSIKESATPDVVKALYA